MTDVLYVLTDKENRKSERELRLSLRSLKKNCLDLGKVYICTDELPDWIQNVEHIKCCDEYEEPEKNVWNKLNTFVEIKDINEFLFMNDDFYMLKEFIAKEYPYYYRGKLVYIDNPSRWQKVNNETLHTLQDTWSLDWFDYCVHCPILYSKEQYKRMTDRVADFYFWKHQECGLSIRCIYGNFVGSDNKKQVLDCKLWHGEPLRESDTGCVSTADGADDVLDEIEKIFDKKSKYEK